MFTGIVEAIGQVKEMVNENSNKHFKIESPIGTELKVDQSVSHNGVCLTVTKVEGNCHWVTAIEETLQKSNLGNLNVSDRVNLERCMKADGRFDGHIVQGHVDGTAVCQHISDRDGSFLIQFFFNPSSNSLIVEKGSICLNGVSLTCFEVTKNSYQVAIIPYTWDHTTFSDLKVGDAVNVEFDIIGKYVRAILLGRQH